LKHDCQLIELEVQSIDNHAVYCAFIWG